MATRRCWPEGKDKAAHDDVILAEKGGLTPAALEAWPRLDAIPFESEHMYMATLHPHAGEDGVVLYVAALTLVALVGMIDPPRRVRHGAH